MQIFAKHLEKHAIFWCLGLSLVVLVCDYLTEPFVYFPILYVFPVALLAWFRSYGWAIFLALILCAIREATSVQWSLINRFDLSIVLINGLIDLGVLMLMALLISQVAKQQRALEAEVRVLEGILPVCGFCKKIRNENETWEPIEAFISRNSEAQFSHSVCPDCGQKHYAQFCEPVPPAAQISAATAN